MNDETLKRMKHPSKIYNPNNNKITNDDIVNENLRNFNELNKSINDLKNRLNIIEKTLTENNIILKTQCESMIEDKELLKNIDNKIDK